ncbi:hypothetical protein Tco_0280383 [Tanacetum coccineum]
MLQVVTVCDPPRLQARSRAASPRYGCGDDDELLDMGMAREKPCLPGDSRYVVDGAEFCKLMKVPVEFLAGQPGPPDSIVNIGLSLARRGSCLLLSDGTMAFPPSN